jgi:uncharacterized membrane protein HdeD (DUF308 family)
MSKQIKKWIWIAGALAIALHIYFIRELFAAEILFGLFIGALLLVVFVCYLAQQVWQLSAAWAKPLTHTVAQKARRGWSLVEEVSRKPFRHQRSESAQ